MTRTNVGNLRIESNGRAVKLSQHVPHPTHLDCWLTFDEVQTLIGVLRSLKPSADDFDELL